MPHLYHTGADLSKIRLAETGDWAIQTGVKSEVLLKNQN